MTTYKITDETRDKFFDIIKKTKKREKIALLCVDKNNDISTGKTYTVGERGSNTDPKNTCKKGTKRIGFFHTHTSKLNNEFSYGDLITGLNKNVKIMCLGNKPDELKCVARKSDKNLKKRLDKNFENYNNINGSAKKFLRGEVSESAERKGDRAAKKLLKREFKLFRF